MQSLSLIPERQNESHRIRYLAAMRQLYNEDKRFNVIWFLASIGIAVVGTGALVLFANYQSLITWFALLVSISELVLLPNFRLKRADAASIQELFDCEVLDFEWNDALTKKPDPRIIEWAIERFDKRNDKVEAWKKLENWFESSEIYTVPLHQARIVCQKENIMWDSGQRREWARWMVGSTALFVIVLVSVGILVDWRLQQLLSGPILLTIPLMIAVGGHAFNHIDAANRLEYLATVVDKLWDDATREDANIDLITRRTRNVQNELYHHRKDSVPVFEWFYRKLGKKYAPVSRANKQET